MSSSVDNRVVSMEFDNAKFEKNATITQKTLAKLKSMLNFKDAGQNFSNLDKAAGKVNFSAMEKALATVSSRFTTLGIIGMTVLQNLTNKAVDAAAKMGSALTSAIVQGGKTRALNLEHAQFQIEGLLGKGSWEKIQSDIEYGVKDTAYGLDAAAKVASQLAASQVQIGDNMKTSLRSISGVAAMTNSTYEDIGSIYTTVAGNGRLMSEQLLQLSSRGINAAAVLGQQLGKSEAEIRDMVSKGQIDFQTFANAMDAAFGTHAKDANQTFTGALSNMKAALSRLGAAFYTPGFDYARDVINALTPVIDDAKAGLEPFISLVTEGMRVVSEFAVDALGKLDAKKIFGRFSLLVASLVPGFKNIGTIISSIFDSIKKAFTTVFPPIERMNGKITSLGTSFAKFTNKLKPSEDALNKIQRVFQGIFSAISLGMKVFAAIGSAFGKLLSALSPIGGVLLDVAASIGDFITGMNQAASKSEGFAKAMTTIHDALRSFADGFSNVYYKLKDFFSNFISNAISILSSIGAKIREAFNAIFNSIGDFNSTLSKKFDFTDVINVITTGLFGGVLYKVFQFITELKKGIDNAPTDTIRQKIKDVLGSLSDTLGQLQESIKVNMILKIAVAVGILAASCYTLAKVDPERLVAALGALTVMFYELFAGMSALLKMMEGPKLKSTFANMEIVTNSMMKLATAVLILAFAVEKLGKLSWKELAKGLGGVAAVCFTLVKTMQKADFSKIKPSSFVGLLGLAVAINILASAVKKLGSLDVKSLVKGLGSMMIVMGSLIGFIAAFDKIDPSKGMVKTASGMILIGISINILAKAIEKLGRLSVKELAKGLGSFAVVLTALMIAMNKMPNGGRIMASAAAMIQIGIALNLLARAIGILGDMSMEQLAKGFGVMVASLMVFVAVLEHLSFVSKGPFGADLLVISSSIAILAVAINILVPAIQALGSMSVENIIKSIVTLAAVLGVLGAAAYLLTPLIPALLGLAAAVALFGVGIAALGTGVVAISAGLAALAGSCSFLVEMLTSMVLSLIRLIPEAATALAEGLVLFLMTVLQGAPKIVEGLVSLLQQILSALTGLVPQLMELVTEILSSLMETLTVLLPQFIDLVVLTIQNLIEAVIELLPDVINLGMQLILSLLQGISDNIFEVVAKAAEIVINFINGLAEQLPAIIQAGFNLMISFLNGLADGIRANMGLVMEAVWNVITAIIDSVLSTLLGAVGSMLSAGIEFVKGAIDGIGRGIDGARNAVTSVIRGVIDTVGGFVGEMLTAGRNLIQGLIDGIGQMFDAAVSAVTGIGNAIIDGVKGLLGIASPSKVFTQLGIYTMQGFIVGVNKMSSKVVDSVTSVGSDAIDSMKETLSNVGATIAKDISSDMTITPVLDLSNVNKGIDSIYSSLSKPASISLDATTNKALSALNTNKVAAEASSSQGQVIYNNYDLTQNNYSPKALSRIDIYRGTKNQFSRLKGLGVA